MAAIARFIAEHRESERFSADFGRISGGAQRKEFDVVVENLSVTGISISAIPGLIAGDEITLDIPGLGARRTLVVHVTDGYYGCEFIRPLTDAELSRALNPRSAVVIAFPTSAAADAEGAFPEPFVAPYSPRQRGLWWIGLGIASWAAVTGAIVLVVAAI
ncbi:MAG: PilZ domain-containing protein [Novosphingobium sp.]